MTECEWIVCERSARWASALRTAIGRQTPPPIGKCDLREIRSLHELAERLANRPRAVALVEVRRTNLAEALTWLSDAGSSYPQARFFALLVREEFGHEGCSSAAEALLAAGAVDVADSPRHLQHVLAAGRRHAASQAHKPTGPSESQTIAEWAWALLPWQRT